MLRNSPGRLTVCPFRYSWSLFGRNTAPALTLAALTLSEQSSNGDSPIMLVLPADHVISDVTAFQRAIAVAAEMAEHDYIVTFGITPSFPSVGYGYIRRGDEFFNGFKSVPCAAYELAEFVEKPNLDTARSMLETEEYLWNSGMFVLRASAWLEEIERFRPDIADACRRAHASGTHDGLFFRPDSETFAASPPDTIDYAVMERIVGSESSRRALVVPIDAGWSDVGSWAAIMDVSDKDDDGNVVRGDVYTHETRNSMVFGHNRLVATVGLEDVIVVDTPDAVLAANRNRVEDVKALVEQLKAEGRPESENHRRGSQALGLVRSHRLRPPIPGQAHHRQSWSGAVAADAPPPVRALGGGQRDCEDRQRRWRLAAVRERVGIREGW